MDEYPDKLKLLGDPTRFKILQFLAAPVESYCTRDDGVCGCDLETYLELTQPTVSHHMKKLVEAGLVVREQRGRMAHYSIVPEAFAQIRDIVDVRGLIRD